MRYPRLVALALSVALTSACSAPEPSSDAAQPVATTGAAQATNGASERKYLLERVDDAAVVQLYADGFASLPLQEKTLLWHLSQAAIAGRDIYIDQKHRNALEMRAVLEVAPLHRWSCCRRA